MTSSSVPLSPDAIFVLRIVIWIFASLSITGALFIIVTYLVFPKLRTKTTRLVFHLSLCDFGSAFSFLMTIFLDYTPRDPFKVGAYCITQGFILQFSNLASFFWTLSIAVHAYMALVKKAPRESLDDLYTYSLLINYSIPLLFATTMLLADAYAFAGVEFGDTGKNYAVNANPKKNPKSKHFSS